MTALADAVHEHFVQSDMPELVECRKVPSGYEFAEATKVPYSVSDPEGYLGDDELWYWGPATRFTDPLVIDGYHLTSMHASEHTTPHFVEENLEHIDDGPITLGCVIVSFSGADGDDDVPPEWAWVVKG
ncbi:hypothetical protein MUG78_16860 [Gordonia alkaliphila]|uniref:hypothetical protein n=1 Tax=Gordonia alkaliphila TaxID=1053547 RepID=UPI001FF4BE95|nr:hypothetical protein [Gordonia alkaliphila]MCK0441072.1 hypothetical protein [Gordonia alkaliphila]